MTTYTFLKIFVFCICGLVGLLGGIAFSNAKNAKSYFKKYAAVSMIFGVVSGLLSTNFLTDDVEVAMSIAVITSLFTLDVSREIREILSNISELTVDVAKKKLDLTEKEKEQTIEEIDALMKKDIETANK